MKIDMIIIGLIAGLSGLYALHSSFGVAGVGAGLAVMAIYALLLKVKAKKPVERSLFHNIRFKLPIILVLAGIIWVMAGKFNFPVWWQIEFVSFAFVGFFFFTLLDLKTLKQEKSSWDWLIRLLATYALASSIFIVVTAQLPQFDPELELAKLNRPPLKLADAAGPEVIAAGREVFENNKCFNCHKVFWEGNSDRGPNLGTKQIGLYNNDYIKEQILDPRKKQSPGFDDPKSIKAMPTYYGDDLSEDELTALVAYLKTMRDPTHMPVEGKYGDQWTWWDDKEVLAEGQQVFEGVHPATEGLSCAVCHGKDGTPMMTGALDFRDENNKDTDKIEGDHSDKLLKDWPDDLWYRRVTRGVPNTPMAPWGMIFEHLYLWKAEAYARTFHDPLDKRTARRPVPPVPSKEEIESWTTKEMFLDPLL
ncbi:MAG: cytochrome c [Nitrospinaceae bacterium]|jgi:mono/diheme cytochrome c family protein|nr:cytochrome c [Nitrospina sp.]MBT5375235.1 cytochrome c [Nitrospinaceae bacterium]MBT5869823.1 cytochrome c [Nitrospinaceae bacterium]MBT6346931.1 cytochrome c [Nitrospina sp.]